MSTSVFEIVGFELGSGLGYIGLRVRLYWASNGSIGTIFISAMYKRNASLPVAPSIQLHFFSFEFRVGVHIRVMSSITRVGTSRRPSAVSSKYFAN